MLNYITNTKTQKDIIHIWIINLYGDVLVDKIDKNKPRIEIEDITISEDKIENAVIKIYSKYKETVNMNKLEEVYTYVTEKEKNNVRGYAYSLTYAESEDFLKRNPEAQFISYFELDDYFKGVQKSNDFKEGFYSLLKFLDDRYGYHRI